tara:strand:+ start:2136 stop:2390 length:255 start_codon:yes stop_codon:yes gene_type:complete
MIQLKNGLILSEDKTGFESFNHLTKKIDKGSYAKFSELPDYFYKEMEEDDRNTLLKVSNNLMRHGVDNFSNSLSDILERTRTKF